MSFRQLNVRLPEDVRCLIPKGNMAGWVSAAIRAHYEAEVARGRMEAVPDYVRRGRPAPPPPVADSAPPALVAPKRGFDWVPDPADMQAGFYVVKPETFHTYNEGGTHRIEIIAGPAYPYGDNWQGQFVAWSPGDTNAPFVPDPGVLAAALAHDEARIAAILARRSAV